MASHAFQVLTSIGVKGSLDAFIAFVLLKSSCRLQSTGPSLLCHLALVQEFSSDSLHTFSLKRHCYVNALCTKSNVIKDFGTLPLIMQHCNGALWLPVFRFISCDSVFPVNREMRWQIRFFLSAGTNYICVKKLAKEIRALHPHQSFFVIG